MKRIAMLSVVLFSSFAMAGAVKTAPIPRLAEPVEVKPAPMVKPTGLPTSGAAPSLEAFKAKQAELAAAAANQNTPAADKQNAPAAVTCSVGQFAKDVAAGTEFSAAEAETLVKQGVVTRGNCGAQGVAGYDVEARSNLLRAGLYVSTKINGKTVGQLNPSEQAGLDNVWAEGLAEAKNRTADNENQVSVASQVAVAHQLKEACSIRN